MNKLAVITGASSGIGEEYAYQLSEKGYNLLITSRSENKLVEIKNNIETKYRNVVDVFPADLSNRDDLDRLCEKIKAIENLDLLVNNAGFALPTPFLELPYNRNQDMIEVHVTAVTKLSYIVLKKLMEKKTGGIITVSSVAAFISSGLYGGTKSFQVKFSKKLKQICKGTDIKIQVLCPGYVRTNFHYTKEYEGIDIKKRVSSWLWMDKDFVVKDSLKNFKKGKLIVVPSLKYKIILFFSKLGLISR